MNICVYCGSRAPKNEEMRLGAQQLGTEIAKHGWKMVYGGAKIGVMGLVADACLAGGGKVTGVIPTSLKRAEVAHPGITRMHETQDMHTRKALMESLSDAFVVLPGGFGTMDEFFEILTWRQLGFHQKKIILVNVDGYYDGLIQYVNRAMDEDFIRPISKLLFHEVPNIKECINLLETIG